MRGIITKAIGGFYYIESSDKKIYETRARGKLRHENIKPLVGDYVKFLNDGSLGYIQSIEVRKNFMIRPAIANVDQVAIVISAKEPNFSSYLLNIFLALVEHKRIEPLIIITKCDLLDQNEITNDQINSFITDDYTLIKIDNKSKLGIDILKKKLKNKITVFTGQTGVGKSSTLNNLCSALNITTQEISRSLGRGKHTTRHVELFDIAGGKVADTPGFSSLELIEMTPEDLAHSYSIFAKLSEFCKFRNCLHDCDNDCAVIKAVKEHKISEIKYKDYLKILKKLKEGKLWK